MLGSQDVWQIVEKDYEKSQNEMDLSRVEKDPLLKIRKKDQQVFDLIYQCLDDSIFEKMTDTTLKEDWKTLVKTLQSVDH